MTWDDGEPKIGRVFTPKLEALLGPARRPRGAGRRRGTRRSPRRCRRVFEEAAFTCSAALHARDRQSEALPRGRLRDEQRGQRQDPRSDAVHGRLHPARRRATTAPRLARRFYVWHQSRRRAARFVMRHGYWGPQFDDGDDRRRARRAERRGRSRGAAASPHRETTQQLVRVDRRRASPTGRSSAGSRDGWNGARARSATAASSPIPRRRDMRDIINTQDQVPREVPAVRAVGRWTRRSTTTSSTRCPTRS